MDSVAVRLSPFVEFAREYDDWFDTHIHAYQSELAAIRLSIPERGRGVEIGVGSGRFASRLGIPLGVDPSEQLAAIARSRGVIVHRAVAEMLPFETGTFDFALLVNVLCFVHDPLGSLKEAHRILKHEGLIILALIDKTSRLGRKYESTKVSDRFYKEANFLSAGEAIGLVCGAGFGHVLARQTIFSNPDEMTLPDPVYDGHGQGAFVVLTALKDQRGTPNENAHTHQ